MADFANFYRPVSLFQCSFPLYLVPSSKQPDLSAAIQWVFLNDMVVVAMRCKWVYNSSADGGMGVGTE